MSEGSGNRNGGSQVSTVDLMVIIIIVLLARIVDREGDASVL